jgi:hypothetical protein
VECGRSKPRAEVWHLIFVDLGEVAIYCPECAEREFDLRPGVDELQAD